MTHPQNANTGDTDAQADDRSRENQRSHDDGQNRTKKDGHADQLGTGQDQTSSRQHGQGARRPG
ncbi:hypothetical protein CAL12_14120 [Bordetella genomosp. 8]|uniref:Uncharacterized protein n=1 Tax=Bordetella genomosp. 8 TaxID=1416806 RepID=A0A1W6YL72_9BORD|nr:hypothetical protein [Bordetella genomosp. 8]ARP81840.1 hypothetical protein CAL12_14120 [Bordetella genomosp. 8]